MPATRHLAFHAPKILRGGGSHFSLAKLGEFGTRYGSALLQAGLLASLFFGVGLEAPAAAQLWYETRNLHGTTWSELTATTATVAVARGTNSIYVRDPLGPADAQIPKCNGSGDAPRIDWEGKWVFKPRGPLRLRTGLEHPLVQSKHRGIAYCFDNYSRTSINIHENVEPGTYRESLTWLGADGTDLQNRYVDITVIVLEEAGPPPPPPPPVAPPPPPVAPPPPPPSPPPPPPEPEPEPEALSAGFELPGATCGDGLCTAVQGTTYTIRNTSTGSLVSILWAFGDGRESRKREPRHTWKAPGFYRLELVVTDGEETLSAYRDVLVRPSEPAGDCEPDGERLCLGDSRFALNVEWWTEEGDAPRAGQVVHSGTNDSGLFRFFDGDNWEILTKVLDGCEVNGKTWVFVASATNLGYRLLVEDTATEEVKEYTSAPGEHAPAVVDVAAFDDACPSSPAAGPGH